METRTHSFTRRILMVVEDVDAAEDLGRMAGALGFEVHGPAASAAEALQMIPEHCPDLVLSGIRLEGPTDGIDLAEMVQTRFGIPVVLVMEGIDNRGIERVRKVRPYGFVIQPLEEPYLQVAIEMAILAAEEDQKLRAAEEALRVREDQCLGMFDQAAVSVALADLDGNLTRCNPAFARLLGYSREELGRRTILDVTHPDHDTETRHYLQRLISGEIPCHRTDKQYIHRQGKAVWVNLVVNPLRSPDGTPIGFIGVATDITERRKALEEQRENEEKYRTILDHMDDGYYEVDLSGNFVFCNEAMGRILGREPGELLGMNNRVYMDPDTAAVVYETFHRVFLTGEPARGQDWPLIHRNGSTIIVETSVFCRRDPEGKPAGFRGICRDVTARKREEAERERLVLELTQAFSEVKTLRGLIPICSGCKKIRTDDGFWEQMERYIETHSEAMISHSLCPDCAKRLYPSYFPED